MHTVGIGLLNQAFTLSSLNSFKSDLECAIKLLFVIFQMALIEVWLHYLNFFLIKVICH